MIQTNKPMRGTIPKHALNLGGISNATTRITSYGEIQPLIAGDARASAGGA